MRGRICAAEALIAAWSLAACSWAWGQAPATPPARDDTAAEAVTAQEAQRWWETDIWKDPERGFYYYPPPKQRRPPPAKRGDPQTPATPQARSLKDITDHDELKAERERRLKVAIMNPTPQNMAAYLEANTYVMQKGAMFADMWRRTLWSHPEYDFNVQNPNANFAQVQLRQERTQRKNATMKDLARRFGIVFFYRGDCAYCKLQAPVLKMLEDSYGMEVLAVGLDGAPLQGWPGARPDNGISMVVSGGRGVPVVPTLYLVSRDTRESVMLGAGVLALDEIVERVHVLTQLSPGEDVGGGVR